MSSDTRNDIHRRSTCRICMSTDLELVIELGPTALANAFLSTEAKFGAERTYPLDLYFCRDCSLLQLLDVVDPAILFRHYLYVTGTSTTMAAHNRAYADTVSQLLPLTATDLVVEIASNDGSLVKCFQPFGVRTLGIEPARNLAAQAEASGVETINEFFTRELAVSLRDTRQPARVILANNVFAHVDDPGDFLSGCRELIADDGLIAIEVPYVRDFVERLEYDTVYHEHLSYFSVTSLLRLCDRIGLSAVRIDRQAVHGGSLRLYLSRSATGHGAQATALAEAERQDGMTGVDRYARFADDVRQSRTALVTLLEALAADGKRVVGYGAPAKGNTLLSFCGIDTRLLPFTVDRNPLKVGRYTPGTHIPVRDVSALTSDGRPDYVLILAWNFAEEIMNQERQLHDDGTRFILPVPVAKVV